MGTARRQTDLGLRPESGRKSDPEEIAFPGRRSFLSVLLGVGTVTMGALLSVPLARFTLYPLFARTTETKWSDLGAVKEFSSITSPVKRLVTVERLDGWRENVSEQAVYVNRSGSGHLRVLSTICPHLGCSVSWHEDRRLFICPCHGGVFAPDGTLISGPPPRSMDALNTKTEDGTLKVEYQYFRKLVPTKVLIG